MGARRVIRGIYRYFPVYIQEFNLKIKIFIFINKIYIRGAPFLIGDNYCICELIPLYYKCATARRARATQNKGIKDYAIH